MEYWAENIQVLLYNQTNVKNLKEESFEIIGWVGIEKPIEEKHQAEDMKVWD